MIQARFIDRGYDKRGNIVAYMLKDSNGQEKMVNRQELKVAIQKKLIRVSNLKLTEDNRLIEIKGPAMIGMDEEIMWDIISRVVNKSTSLGEAAKKLEKLLAHELTNEDAVKFSKIAWGLHSKLTIGETGNILAKILYSRTGYISDDGLTDYCAALMSTGKSAYYALINNPHSLNILLDTQPQFERCQLRQGELFGYALCSHL